MGARTRAGTRIEKKVGGGREKEADNLGTFETVMGMGWQTREGGRCQ